MKDSKLRFPEVENDIENKESHVIAGSPDVQ